MAANPVCSGPGDAIALFANGAPARTLPAAVATTETIPHARAIG
jgi:hypothetical protein